MNNSVKDGIYPYLQILVVSVLLIWGFQANASENVKDFTLSCRADNDLYIVLKENRYYACQTCEFWKFYPRQSEVHIHVINFQHYFKIFYLL